MAFHGKVALVTGAGSGMGQISAWRLADAGAQVAALDLNEQGLAKTAEGRDNVHVYPCDVTDRQQVEQVVGEIRDKLGPIDRVTHAAAIMPASPLVDMPVEQILKLMEVNYAGTVY
ncbi:MAG: SDR family NAD(P)-dependent oxidoreductase, partial [Deltaproteobacteria bacterium]